MKTTILSNNGDFAIGCISVFGASAKNSSTAIGKFGTGLKYAIAILLREGIDISLWIKGVEYKFGTTNLNMRGKSFAQVTMNGSNLPFTTELGSHWELWQAYRELESNCRDEQGSTDIYEDDNYSINDDIAFVVKSDEFAELAENNTVFLDATPDEELSTISVVKEASNVVYHNGIKVFETDIPYANTYDLIGDIELTEDRTLKDPLVINSRILTLLRANTDYEFFKSICVVTEENKKEDDICYWYSFLTDSLKDHVQRALDEGLKVNASLETEYKRLKETYEQDNSNELVIRVFHKNECLLNERKIKEAMMDYFHEDHDLDVVTIEIEGV